ncbi:MAG: hypothetical protein GEV03_21280 [Streptosporangiales bacterium]|nr:hypothetical protein [Streptosporangiales bacterium]
MSRLLFLTWNGAGNQPPAIALAQELTVRGHEVTFAGYASQRVRFDELGFDFRLLERADAAYPERPPPEGWMAALVDAVWACPEQLADLTDILDANSYDVVVVDCLMFGALALLEKLSVPVAVLVHSAPGPLAAPGDGMEQLLLAPLNELRAQAGRPEVERLWDAWAPFPTLCASIDELDPLAQKVPPSFTYVGPLFERMPPSRWRSPWPSDDPRPLVLASFSTGPAWDQTSRIRRTLCALADGRHRVLVTTSESDVEGLTVPGNATLLPHLPHAEVLPDAVLTVTHAGHGTVSASLAHGVPIVALPNPAADQPALARRVAELGAGYALDGESAAAMDIAAAVDAVLADGSYATAARRLAESIASSPGVRGAAALLERLAR